MTSLNFPRADIEGALMPIDIDDDLGGIGDRPGSVGRMDIPEEGEIGQAAVVQYIGADQHEEVAEHSIAGPIHSEVRQTIEKVVSACPGFFDHTLEFAYDGLKSLSQLKRVSFYTWGIQYQRIMLGKTEVDEASAGSMGEITVGLDKGHIFFGGADLPYHIVARDDATQDAVEMGKSRAALWLVVRHDFSLNPALGNGPFQAMAIIQDEREEAR
jgi:hypothetical protein